MWFLQKRGYGNKKNKDPTVKMGVDGKRGGAKRWKWKKLSAVFTEKGKRGNIRCGANRSQEGLRQSKGGIWGTSTPNTKKRPHRGTFGAKKVQESI